MARYFGKVGYGFMVETAPDTFTQKIVEREYYGDVISNYRRLDPSQFTQVNNKLSVNSSISIVADDYGISHAPLIKYVEYMGQLWNVSSLRIERPRIILEIGDLYERIDN